MNVLHGLLKISGTARLFSSPGHGRRPDTAGRRDGGRPHGGDHDDGRRPPPRDLAASNALDDGEVFEAIKAPCADMPSCSCNRWSPCRSAACVLRMPITHSPWHCPCAAALSAIATERGLVSAIDNLLLFRLAIGGRPARSFGHRVLLQHFGRDHARCGLLSGLRRFPGG